MWVILRRVFATFLAAGLWSAGAIHAQTASARDQFIKLIEHPRIPLSPRVVPLPDITGRLRYQFSFASDSNQRVPGILMRRESLIGNRFPVVIALHGTGGDKKRQLPLLLQLRARGLIGVGLRV